MLKLGSARLTVIGSSIIIDVISVFHPSKYIGYFVVSLDWKDVYRLQLRYEMVIQFEHIIYEGAQILLHECHRLMLSLSLSLFCNSHAVVPCAKWFDVVK